MKFIGGLALLITFLGTCVSRSVNVKIQAPSLIGPWQKRSTDAKEFNSNGLQDSTLGGHYSSNNLYKKDYSSESNNLDGLAREIVYRNKRVTQAAKENSKKGRFTETETEDVKNYEREVRPTRPRGLWGRKDPKEVFDSDESHVLQYRSLLNHALRLRDELQKEEVTSQEREERPPPGLWGREKDN